MESEGMTKSDALEIAADQVIGPFRVDPGPRGWAWKTYDDSQEAWWMHDAGYSYQDVQARVSLAKARKAAYLYAESRGIEGRAMPLRHDVMLVAASIGKYSSTLAKMNAILMDLG